MAADIILGESQSGPAAHPAYRSVPYCTHIVGIPRPAVINEYYQKLYAIPCTRYHQYPPLPPTQLSRLHLSSALTGLDGKFPSGNAVARTASTVLRIRYSCSAACVETGGLNSKGNQCPLSRHAAPQSRVAHTVRHNL